MIHRIYLIALVCIVLGCAAQKKGTGHTRTRRVVFLDEETYLLTEKTSDVSYGFSRQHPVKVGSTGGGPRNERRFLNALLGPNGEPVQYYRAGSCCPFRTPNGLLDNTGLLDHYRVSWSGAADTLSIYINMYDEGDLFIPVGFTAKAP